MKDLEGKIAFVTGASRGIGRAIALKLADYGVHVIVNYLRKKELGEETASAIKAKGVNSIAIKGNVANDNDINRMFDIINAEFGSLDILVANAASGVLKPISELTTRHWQWAMDINARSLLPMSQHATKLMMQGKNKGGNILAVSSLGAVRAIENYAAVGASKAALESLVRHLAVDLAPHNIKVNVIQAGVVDTEALKSFPNRLEILEIARKGTPSGRLVTPDDVADVVLLLCSDKAQMIQGQTIVLDGGYSIKA